LHWLLFTIDGHAAPRSNRVMHRRFLTALAAALIPSAFAADLAGRWEGVAQIPGAPQPIVLDIAPGAGGAWSGSLTLPGRGMKGAPLRELRVSARDVRALLGTAFPGQPDTSPEITLSALADGSLAGEFRMAGHSAPVALGRTGDAQVDLPVPATAIAAALSGTWTGRYELGGVPRDVTLKLANDSRGLGAGELRIVGKRTTVLPIDRVVQGREFVSFESSDAALRIEGRWATPDGSIQGQVLNGPFAAPLVLRRAAAKEAS
jgi:hypothetical protein